MHCEIELACCRGLSYSQASRAKNPARIMKMKSIDRKSSQESSGEYEKALPFSERDLTDKHSTTDSESGSSEKSSEISERRREVSDVAIRQNRVEPAGKQHSISTFGANKNVRRSASAQITAQQPEEKERLHCDRTGSGGS
jgi:hypothetical protein